MRIATWNLKRPGHTQSERVSRLRQKMDEVDADVWVLTETNASVRPAGDFHGVVTPAVDGLHRRGESWTTIWSRFPIVKEFTTHEPAIAACIEVESPTGRLLIYGTVLPYEKDKQQHGMKNWQSHYESIPRHEEDWRRIRTEFPSHPFCVAGDFNQSRDERRWNGRLWYGTQDGRQMLTAAMDRSNIQCLTEGNALGEDQLKLRSTIDHICLDVEWAKRVRRVDAWEHVAEDGFRYSDHNGVCITVE